MRLRFETEKPTKKRRRGEPDPDYGRGGKSTLDTRLAMMPSEEFERREQRLVDELLAWQANRLRRLAEAAPEPSPRESMPTDQPIHSTPMDHQERAEEERVVVPFPRVVNFQG